MAAGSKPGEYRGGRKKGTRNHASIKRQEQVYATGLAPLDFMLEVMRNEDNPRDVRLEAAKAAAPYVHPKLATLQTNVSLSGKLTLEQLVAGSIAASATAASVEADGENQA
jgi:hypothetical protein